MLWKKNKKHEAGQRGGERRVTTEGDQNMPPQNATFAYR